MWWFKSKPLPKRMIIMTVDWVIVDRDKTPNTDHCHHPQQKACSVNTDMTEQDMRDLCQKMNDEHGSAPSSPRFSVEKLIGCLWTNEDYEIEY